MDIFKLTGVFVVASCGIGGTYLLNLNARAALWQAEGFISLLRFLRSEVECFALPIPSILARCPEEIWRACSYKAEAVPKNIEEVIKSSDIKDARILSCLERFGRSFGRGYRQEQLSICDECIGELEQIRKRIADQLPARIKTNGAICICSAMAVVILLL